MNPIRVTKKTALGLSLFFLILLGGVNPLQAEDVCGDFNITGTEGCDNGSLCDDGFTDCSFDPSVCGDGSCSPRNGDGCPSDCSSFEPGWDCFNFEFDLGGGIIILFTFCQTICGDGLQVGAEVCDDGNLVSGDGCDVDFNGSCVVSACGNFVHAPDGVDPYVPEACDDGNFVDGDGCSADCAVVEAGWICEDLSGFSLCQTNCGDGLFAGAEECEDGKQCDSGLDCTLDESVCGDGSCAARNGDGCDNDASNPDVEQVGNCTFTDCGNQVRTEGEDCDDGNTDDADFITDYCDSNCTFVGCGNGVADHIHTDFLTLDEPCDDGNDFNGDGCDNNCTVTACGNGVLTEGEICDDGNTADDDGCSGDCQPECGDGAQGSNEECDDGNIKSGDDCSSVCTLETDPGVCGNGILEEGEECDDGNTEGDDGCESDCTDQTFESANPTLTFAGLFVGDSVILNAPDPRGDSSALEAKAAVLPEDCDCTWSISPLALGNFSDRTVCQTELTLNTEGDGILSVDTDCGADGSGSFLQTIVVQPKPVAESGGCSLIR